MARNSGSSSVDMVVCGSDGVMVGTTMDNFVLLPDQTYHDVDHDGMENHDDNEDTDSDNDSQEYIKEMELILRKIRRKKSRGTGENIHSLG